MRILHLFANYKWTGPADPAIRCAASLRQIGCDVVFARAEWTLPDAEHRMAIELRNARMPVVAGLELRKHFRVGALRRDVRALRARLDRGDFDVVHAHMLADHLTAALAKGKARRVPVVVRSFYDPVPPSRFGWRNRVALGHSDGVVVPTRAVERAMGSFGLSPDRVLYQDPPIGTERRAASSDLRSEWGVSTDECLFGITARIQPHRRFELLWATMRKLVDERPNAKLVLLGRGNAEDTERLVTRPVRELGLESNVLLPGYLYEPDYSRALRSLDAFVFLVPGSDGSCRAVREAMALGVPVASTARGILPELVGGNTEHGASGIVVEDETADAFSAAMLRLCDDIDERTRLGRNALRRVDTSMDPLAAAKRLRDFYQRLASTR